MIKVTYICLYKIYKNMKAKLIHLDEKVIESLTIMAVKEKTTFKEFVQKILTEKSEEYDREKSVKKD